MKRILHLFFSICVTVLTTINVLAQRQTTLPIRFSPHQGAVIFFSNRTLSQDRPLNNMVAVRLSRDTGRGYKPLIQIARAATQSEFITVCGAEVWSDFKTQKGFTSDDEAWRFILEHPGLDDYGFLSFNINFAQAMGCAYYDREATTARKTWRYRAEWLTADGQVAQMQEGIITDKSVGLNFPKPLKLHAFATDSLSALKWFVPRAPDNGTIVFAEVYRQEAGKGPFEKLDQRVIASQQNDTLTFSFQETVKPERLYRYFIVPTDGLSNLGEPSDTISILSIDFNNLPLLDSVTAKDTLNAIRVSWKSLGDLPALIGVEIQRSRDARGNYVIIDTVSTVTNGYLDKRVVPGIPYYYRLRILGLNTMERETGYSGYTTASVTNSIKPPDPPYGLTASIEDGQVKLQWQAVPDIDLYGYFVYRGVSVNGPFEVISPALTGTSFTDTTVASVRVHYVYTVKAVNQNSLESEYSNHVSISPPVRTLPSPPSGISATAYNGVTILTWPSTATRDHAVAGYNVYRREVQSSKRFDLERSAAAQAAELNFRLLNTLLVPSPRYEDVSVEPNKTYEYAVSVVDRFGMESSFSSFGIVTYSLPERLLETAYVRKVVNGIKIEWGSEFQPGATSITIHRKKAGSASFQQIATLNPSITEYTDQTAVGGALYVYQIRAEDNKRTIARSDDKDIWF